MDTLFMQLLRDNADKIYLAGVILVATLFVMCPSCTSSTMESNSRAKSTSNKNRKPRTIYLIRHAETEENVRMQGFHEVGKALQKGKLPSSSSVKLGSQFVGMTLSGNHNSKLSARGKQQVLQLQSILQDNDNESKTNEAIFGDNKNSQSKGLDMIVHSPLQRAKETCYGIFKLRGTTTTNSAAVSPPPRSISSAGNDDNNIDDVDSSIQNNNNNNSRKQRRRQRPIVVELPSLQEVTQWELKTQGKRPVRKRIRAFEEWLDGLNDDDNDDDDDSISTIAVVGHSEYFMIMLGMEEKFKNCDVWKATYQGGGNWSDLVNVVRLDMFASVECNGSGGGEDDDDNCGEDVQCCGLGPPRRSVQ